MDGQILGYDKEKGEGAIRMDSGDRFTFMTADWRSERDPKAGDKVDFVGADGKATDVYLIKGSFSAPDLSGIGDKFGDADSRAEMLAAVRSNATVGMFLTKPHVAGAGLIILGWLVAGHLLLVTSVGDMFEAMGQMNQAAAFLGGDTGIGLFRSLGVLVLLFMYLIPVFAGLLILQSTKNVETPKQKNRAAFSGLALPILVPLVAFIFIYMGLPGAVRDMLGEGAGRSGFSLFDLIDIDLGWLLMIAGGVLIVLQRMGILKSFGGKT